MERRMTMVDFHSHVLFEVDDGSENLEMSMKMIEQSITEGVKILALTPHHIKGLFEEALTDLDSYNEKFQFLQNHYRERIELVQSAELMINEELIDDLDSGLTFGYGNSKTILVEYNLLDAPTYAEGLFYKLKLAGYQVILAHPERNRALRHDPELLYHLNDLGVLFQLNAGSLLGQFGDKVTHFAKELIKVNLIHAIGSDGHNDQTRDMRIKHAYDTVKELNPKLFDNIMENGPKLIHGEKVTVLPYTPWTSLVKTKKMKKKKKGILQILGF